MRRTKDRHLIVELKKGKDAEHSANKLMKLLSKCIGNRVGSIKQMGMLTELEILDIDAFATKEEVHDAVYKTIVLKGKSNKNVVKVTGLWKRKSGNQIATTQVPKLVA